MYDRIIRLDQTFYWPINEELPKERLEKLASRCFTIETSLQEEGVAVIGYPDSEPRIKDARMLLKICDGMSQGEFLFHLQAIGDEARGNWDEFQLAIDRYIQQIESLDAADGGEYKDTD